MGNLRGKIGTNLEGICTVIITAIVFISFIGWILIK
jgi:hypothetical protein